MKDHIPLPLSLPRPYPIAIGNSDIITPIFKRALKINRSSLIGLWKLNENIGTQALDYSGIGCHGVYTPTFTLNQDGVGDGVRSTLFNNGYVSLTANLPLLDVVFNNQSGTLMGWCKLSLPEWSDGLVHVLAEFGADLNNRVIIYKNTTNNQVVGNYVAGAVNKTVTFTSGALSNFFSLCITWNKLSDQVKLYCNGIQVGATLNGLGVWVGSLNTVWSGIGNERSTTPLDTMIGNLCNICLWSSVLNSQQILKLGVL